jgi:hypothetical protein
MRIKIWASLDPKIPNVGPYKSLDIVERDTPHVIGEMTHYGPVIGLPPFADHESDQSVIVQLNPPSLNVRPDESVLERPPSSYEKIQLFRIYVDPFPFEEPAPDKTTTILEGENLTVEDVSQMITPDTFTVWQQDCFLANATFAVAHRYSSPTDRDPDLDQHSADLVHSAVACLGLIRPTRRSRAGKITGTVKLDGRLEPQSFDAYEPAEVPEVQKLFTIRRRDVETLKMILPEFLRIYEKDCDGKLTDQYEPLRMAMQLYGEAYALHYWKARHILWWAAIESLYGNAEKAATARTFSFFGNKSSINGYRCSIYEKGDVPSCFGYQTPEAVHTLGEMVPRLYKVRNASAHGQKVPDLYFGHIPHPFGTAPGLDVLAEAATFVIRKTLTEILRRGLRDRFKDRDAREDFWLREYALNKRQSEKRLDEMYDLLKT